MSKPLSDRESCKLSGRKVMRGLKFEISTSFQYLHNCVIDFLFFEIILFFVAL